VEDEYRAKRRARALSYYCRAESGDDGMLKKLRGGPRAGGGSGAVIDAFWNHLSAGAREVCRRECFLQWIKLLAFPALSTTPSEYYYRARLSAVLNISG
jgi:hypothetical protein